jgi:hypothetical protein
VGAAKALVPSSQVLLRREDDGLEAELEQLHTLSALVRLSITANAPC